MAFPNIVFGSTGDQFDENNSAASRGRTLGTRMFFDDGRVYRWHRAGTVSIVTAALSQQLLNDANFDELVVPSAVAVGATVVTITNGATTVAADLFADGWLNVEDDTGEGHVYSIRSNAAESAGSTNFDITLKEPVVVAWTTATTVLLYASPYGRTIIHPSPATAMLTGVTPRAITTLLWGWLQTDGPASCITQGTVVINEGVIDSASADGAVAPTASTAAGEENYVGIVMEVAATTEESLINLRQVS